MILYYRKNARVFENIFLEVNADTPPPDAEKMPWKSIELIDCTFYTHTQRCVLQNCNAVIPGGKVAEGRLRTPFKSSDSYFKIYRNDFNFTENNQKI